MRLSLVSLLLVALSGCLGDGLDERRMECSLLILDERKVVGPRDVTLYHKVKGECTNVVEPDMSHAGQR